MTGVHGKLALMRLNPFIHDVAAQTLYVKLEGYGTSLVKCLAMLAAQSPLAVFYGSCVQHLSCVGFRDTDKYLVFPVLGRVLASLSNLRSLRLSCAPSFAPFITMCLDRAKLIRRVYPLSSLLPTLDSTEALITSSAINLSLLRTVGIHCGPEVLSLLHYRPSITSLDIGHFLSYDGLQAVLNAINTERGQRNLERLYVRLHSNLNIPAVMNEISQHLPCLHVLGIEQPSLRCKTLLESLASEGHFKHLQAMLLNYSDDQKAWKWKEKEEKSLHNEFSPLILRAAKRRENFQYVSFGKIVYRVAEGRLTEIISEEEKDGWNERFYKDVFEMWPRSHLTW
ncbi:hypothetical protein BKA70DRAFT_1233297 [Coprinopsis sp. MPI-PUGE-AT-0042]|nr:hypothetical protein BKA70DRAFT_1233297 [Coprinopsis sp. MPI-PUGE-AT-0042]